MKQIRPSLPVLGIIIALFTCKLLQAASPALPVEQKAASHVVAAITNQSFAQVQALINAGVDVAHTDQEGHSFLHHAAAAGCNTILEYLLSLPQGLKLIDKLTNKGETALHIAARQERATCVQILLAQGAQELPTASGESFGLSRMVDIQKATPFAFAACGSDLATLNSFLSHKENQRNLSEHIAVARKEIFDTAPLSVGQLTFRYGSRALFERILAIKAPLDDNPYDEPPSRHYDLGVHVIHREYNYLMASAELQKQRDRREKQRVALEKGIFDIVNKPSMLGNHEVVSRKRLLYASRAQNAYTEYIQNPHSEREWQTNNIIMLFEQLALLNQLDCNALEDNSAPAKSKHCAPNRAPRRLPTVVITEILSHNEHAVKAVCALTAYSGNSRALPKFLMQNIANDTSHPLRKYSPNLLRGYYHHLTAGDNVSMVQSIGTLLYEQAISDAARLDDITFYSSQEFPIFCRNPIVATQMTLLHVLATYDPTQYESYEKLVDEFSAKIRKIFDADTADTLRPIIKEVVQLLANPPYTLPTLFPRRPQQVVDELPRTETDNIDTSHACGD